MRFSEAIRLGALLNPQGFGQLMDNGKTCALGAAFAAIGQIKEIQYGFLNWPEEWKWINIKSIQCPNCGDRNKVLWIIAIHLNDRHKWTRESIADWIESLESTRHGSRFEEPARPTLKSKSELSESEMAMK
jgi:hypothetical protein